MRDELSDRNPDGPTGSFEMFIERRRKKQAQERRRRRQALVIASLGAACAALAVSTTFLAFRLTAATALTVPQRTVVPSADRAADGSRSPGVTKPAVAEPRATTVTQIAARRETSPHGQRPAETAFGPEPDVTQADTRERDDAAVAASREIARGTQRDEDGEAGSGGLSRAPHHERDGSVARPPGDTIARGARRSRDGDPDAKRARDDAPAGVATSRGTAVGETSGDGRRERQPGTRIGPHSPGSRDIPLEPDGTRAGPSLTADWMVKSLGRAGAEERVRTAAEFYPRGNPDGEYWRAVLGHIRRAE